ncbi:acetylxylan esterase [Agriterribacter sp.]|uniref:acetylxylan esterase n=1 Tax=Agriterribacter sp. TaxID=2821509 RepID=UPI002CAA542D|nr:acetylxylan esterase [Agriterribacter sp.]HRO45533.1 acetylxylan esterase [Agriterribacter sp.]HRQ17945.1 acetylxylan esterase [Agriterribacter sp.]
MSAIIFISIRRIALLLIFSVLIGYTQGQPAEQMIKVVVAPDHTDWKYKPGEKVKFTITVLKSGNVVKDAVVKYEIGPEKMEAIKKDSLTIASGILNIDGGTMKTPGFLRCIATAIVNGKSYRGLATAAFNPLQIDPAIQNPSDFSTYWDNAKTALATIPVDARMTLLPERCTENVNVYHVSLQNYKPGTRLYGILCIPKKEGKYPALLQVPGAGVRPYAGDIANAEKGIITFQIGIHGVPVNMDVSVYNNLATGALAGYWNYNLDDKDRYYYKRVYLGCVRANDFLTGLPQYDGKQLAVMGGSQGGALSIVTVALDPRVKFLAALYPALSDVTGYLKGRAGGWPHLFDKNNLAFNNTKEKINTAGYYDVVNFARQLKVPGIYTLGFNDETCPPTSMYAAYNVITAPKELFIVPETGHWTFPEQGEKMNSWIVSKLNEQ